MVKCRTKRNILEMPSYTFSCSGCKIKFELFYSIKEYIENPKCIKCDSKTKTQRSYEDDLHTISSSIRKSDNELKTVGDLANRNRDKLTDDQKYQLEVKHNKYKDEQFKKKKDLPKGMTRHKKQPKTKWT